MTILTIQLNEKDYERLEKTAQQAGKSVQDVIQDWIAELPDTDLSSELAQDPIYQFDGYDSDAPPDLASNLDSYLYLPSVSSTQ
jgi:hypothetical protein